MGKRYVEQRDQAYWIAGTRVSLDSVILAFLQGLSPEAIVSECFPVVLARLRSRSPRAHKQPPPPPISLALPATLPRTPPGSNSHARARRCGRRPLARPGPNGP